MDEKALVLMGVGVLAMCSWYLSRRIRPAEQLPGIREKLSLYVGIFLITVSLAFGIHGNCTGEAGEQQKKLQKFQDQSPGCAGSKQTLKPFKKDP